MVRAKHLPSAVLVFLGGLACPAVSWAAGENTKIDLGKTSGSEAPQMNSGGLFLQMALALAVTVGVIWLVYRGLKIWNKRSQGGGQQSPAVQVISRTEVDRDMTVYVLQLGDTVSVVSRTSQGSTLLRELSREEAEFDGLHKSINPVKQSVGSVLGELRARMSKPKESQPPVRVDDLLEDEVLHVEDLLRPEEGEES